MIVLRAARNPARFKYVPWICEDAECAVADNFQIGTFVIFELAVSAQNVQADELASLMEETQMSTKMTSDEREQFLSDVRIGVLSIADEGMGPLTVPVWYDYIKGGDLVFLTGASSMKGKRLENVERVSLCVQTEDAPYKYVSIEGPIVGRETPDPEKHSRAMAHRYLGKEMGDAYVAGTAGSQTSTLYTVRPERWLTVDYSKMSEG
jgi:uncharacterized protein